ncbi:MAG: glycosyltransferase family 2 protein, partial [Patescibacteria group bacterium]|nr:glycosyltransferase family 2 protein [Patescibacteria group bacterium]
KVSIGLVVYNGEPFTRKKIDSLLSQTFSDFELIISDNASTDGTSDICKEYLKKDKRIRYFRQKENMGASWNYIFVLDQARGEYFTWAAVDDIMLPDFLKNNVAILESDKNIVGSTGKVERYTLVEGDSEKNSIDIKFRNFKSKLISSFRPSSIVSISGSYNQKVRILLKKSAYTTLYCVFRTNELKKSIVRESFVANDAARILSVLKYGDIHVTDEVLMLRYDQGMSTRGSIDISRNYNTTQGVLGIIFPHYPLTIWCIKNLGLKNFIKNIDHFIKLNLASEFLFGLDLMRLLTHKVSRK